MGKVYITQETVRRDEHGQLRPLMNFKPAMEYGELVVCLSSGALAFSPVPTVTQLKEVLHDFGENDYLLAVGDPSVIAIASAIVSERNGGRFKLLKWDKESKMYIVVPIAINHRKREVET